MLIFLIFSKIASKLHKNCILGKNAKMYQILKLLKSCNFYRKYIVNSALESSWPILYPHAFYEHVRAFPEHLWACISCNKNVNFHQKSHFHQHMYTKVLVDARRMLADARKVLRWKVWVKGFSTHTLSCILDKNSLRNLNLKISKRIAKTEPPPPPWVYLGHSALVQMTFEHA